MIATVGAQPIYAEGIPTGEDANPQNNCGVADLDALPAVQVVGVQESTLYEASLAVQWLPLAVPGLAGYRILRAIPWATFTNWSEKLRGLSATISRWSAETMLLLTIVVQAYDASEAVSPYSQEVSGALPPLNTFLPLLSR